MPEPIVTPGFISGTPSDLGPVIYVVGMMRFTPCRGGRLPDTHVAAFYHNLEDALKVLHYLDTECGYYSHLIIETYQPGYIPMVVEERWFEWDKAKDSWLPIAKPEDMHQIINFSLS